MKVTIFLDKNTKLFELKEIKQQFYNVENRLNLSRFAYKVCLKEDDCKEDDCKEFMKSLYDKYSYVIGYKMG